MEADADQRNSMAQHNLGVCYYNKEGVQKNLAEAYYPLAARQGDRDERKMCLLTTFLHPIAIFNNR